MIALPRSATKALKLWPWKDGNGVVDTRENGLNKGTPKASFDMNTSMAEEPKTTESEPIENEVTAPIVRLPSKLVKKRDPSGGESKRDVAPSVPAIDPEPAVSSRPATPSTTHTPPSVDSETAEHVIVPPNPPPSTPKHNVLVKRNSLSKRAAANPTASSEAPPELPTKDVDVPKAIVEYDTVLEQRRTTGEDKIKVEVPPIADSVLEPAEAIESKPEIDPETPATAHPFPMRGSTPPSGTRFIEGADGELEPTESRTTGTNSGARIRPGGRPTRRISLRSFGFFYGKDSRPAAFPAYVAPTHRVVHESVEFEAEAEAESSHRPMHTHKRNNSLLPTGLLRSRKLSAPKITKNDKRAVQSAMSLRTLIIGPAALDSKNARERGGRTGDSKASAAVALRKVNQQLLVPTEANRVIAALRELPPPDLPPAAAVTMETVRKKKGWMFGRGGAKGEHKETVKDTAGTIAMPIHGCCLDLTDEEAEQKHFSKLTGSGFAAQGSASVTNNANANIGSADLFSLIPMLKNMRLVNLQSSPDMASLNAASLRADLTAPDLGFGQTADKDGPLAGSVPSASSLVDGMEKVGQTLMSLGFATTAAVLPSHAGIYPPKDRMSVLTYWWGYEVVFPPPTMRYLGHAKSISGALLNFLTAFALFSNGVREMLPFVRYIAQFIDFEWSAIKAQDKGLGVVCAATWVMPAALVPRPWDFVDPPMMGRGRQSMTPGPATQKPVEPVMTLAEHAFNADNVEAVDGDAFTEVRDGEAGGEREIQHVRSLETQDETETDTRHQAGPVYEGD